MLVAGAYDRKRYARAFTAESEVASFGSIHTSEGKTLDDLIQCECGHRITNHTALGYESVNKGRCRCQRNAQDVLHHAVLDARLEWGRQGSKPTE
jgi:hypothetical protein